jgi:molecular chaperone GrpE
MTDEAETQDEPNEQDGGNGAPGATPAGAAAAAAAATPAERIAQLEAERDELKDRMLRIAAEFENAKKRFRKEQSEAESKAREAVLKDMLEVIDNLERAANASSTSNAAVDAQAVQQGVNLVLRLANSKLERYDVRPVDSRGKPFDPRLHDAISQVASAEVPPGTVLEELQKGYRLGDKLLRPASVVVALAPQPGGGGGGGGDGNGGRSS